MERVLSERVVWKETARRVLLVFPIFRILFSLFTFPSQHYSEYPGALLNGAILIFDGYNHKCLPIIKMVQEKLDSFM